MNKVGKIDDRVISLLGLKTSNNTPVYLGQSNVEHIIKKHNIDYDKYGDDISNIILTPDYVGINISDGSIEYVKEYIENNEYVKVAVRVSTNGNYFVRSIYKLNSSRVKDFIKKGTLKKY